MPWTPDFEVVPPIPDPIPPVVPVVEQPAGELAAQAPILPPANVPALQAVQVLPSPPLVPAGLAPIGVATKPEKFPYFHSYSNVMEAGVLTNPNQKHGPTALVPIPTTAYHPPQIDQPVETPAPA